MRCCRMQRADQRFDRATAFIEHGLAHREHLFDATAPDLRGCERNMADTAIDRDRIPRLADAYAIDLARREYVGGGGRAGDDDLDILIGTKDRKSTRLNSSH